ncbi:MAG: hypothetical protein IIB14_02605 [Chloroflexi bacterium]|nr:hypothetical protein [Chloroflexota bacterium]
MIEYPRRERLQSLTAEAGQALRARAKRLMALPIPAPSSDSPSRRGAPQESSALLGPASTRRRRIAREAMPGLRDVEAPREERSVRALAKEIKRLLTEDRRRGLGVGG